MRRTEEVRGFTGDFLDNFLHILNLLLHFSVWLVLQYDMIPAVIADNAAAVFDELQQLRVFLHPVAVYEENRLGMMLIEGIDQ
ncbi:hypothetical protein D3C73_1380050 [compost metagenome]